MKTIKTVTCSIWSEEAFACACADIGESEDKAKTLALADAREVFIDSDGDFSTFHRIWYTVISFPEQERNDPVIRADLPALPDPEPVTAEISG